MGDTTYFKHYISKHYMGPTPVYGDTAEKNPKNADFVMKQTNICRLSGDIKTGPARSKKPAQAEQKRPENIHRRPRAPTPLYTLKYFYLFFGRIFQIYCFFRPKRPGTRARTVVPLTTPLPSTRLFEGDMNVIMIMLEKLERKVDGYGSALSVIIRNVTALQ